jgi:hypothetical protein
MPPQTKTISESAPQPTGAKRSQLPRTTINKDDADGLPVEAEAQEKGARSRSETKEDDHHSKDGKEASKIRTTGATVTASERDLASDHASVSVDTSAGEAALTPKDEAKEAHRGRKKTTDQLAAKVEPKDKYDLIKRRRENDEAPVAPKKKSKATSNPKSASLSTVTKAGHTKSDDPNPPDKPLHESTPMKVLAVTKVAYLEATAQPSDGTESGVKGNKRRGQRQEQGKTPGIGKKSTDLKAKKRKQNSEDDTANSPSATENSAKKVEDQGSEVSTEPPAKKSKSKGIPRVPSNTTNSPKSKATKVTAAKPRRKSAATKPELEVRPKPKPVTKADTRANKATSTKEERASPPGISPRLELSWYSSTLPPRDPRSCTPSPEPSVKPGSTRAKESNSNTEPLDGDTAGHAPNTKAATGIKEVGEPVGLKVEMHVEDAPEPQLEAATSVPEDLAVPVEDTTKARKVPKTATTSTSVSESFPEGLSASRPITALSPSPAAPGHCPTAANQKKPGDDESVPHPVIAHLD